MTLVSHPALRPGSTAVITGGANGIGLAAGVRYASMGMNVLVADRDVEQLEVAEEALQAAAANGAKTMGLTCDVSIASELTELAQTATETFGTVNVLMNNAGAGMNPGKPWENTGGWKKLLDVNLWGVIHGVQAFVPAMLEAGNPGLVINTGSKQGITRPPGNAAYNLSKAGVIAFTEALAHELRQIEDCQLSAHLLVPGFTYTGMISKFLPEKPDTAWTSEQVVDFMLKSLETDDFYILCPDNDVSRETDERRIQWNADDLIQNRPALSRWHPDYAIAFDEFMKK
ncbi:SDR family NAD(P)-dependent oxidoreductase [Parvibaculaceae bacterium PLY_AMNH_Bact1]|nr:SDR family NAD(P)-dependent oxidoreductase [Parvibaculaceae bacterium PLY_AMNH_Bact1]